MLIDINHTHQSSGLSKVCDFKIETNGIMIKALTSRLYSDPIRSIVRELASNALDACPDQSMKIHLPTPLEPHFSVRDYGAGLSPTSMTEVFTRFGASTKRTSNTQIGGFGLGAKSPFAIVNSYTIVSHHEGTKSTYMASISQDGMPALHCVSTEPTSETGLCVIVPASSKDHDKWRKATDQLQFFKPTPLYNCTIEQPKVIYENDDYLVLSRGDPAVMVGPVTYPLDHNKAGVPSYPFVLKFPIGSIEVTASREDIVYSTATIKTIGDRHLDVYHNYKQRITDLLPTLNSVTEVWRLLQGEVLRSSVTWRGFEVFSDYVYLDRDDGQAPTYNFAVFDRHYRQRRRRWVTSFQRHCRIRPNDHIYIFDDTRKWQERIQAHLSSSQVLGSVILVKDTTEIDALGLPYTRISSLHCSTPTRTMRQRTTAKIMGPRNRPIFPLKADIPSIRHYAFIDGPADSTQACKLVDVPTQFLTTSIYLAICNRMGISAFYLVPQGDTPPANTTDIIPLWRQQVEAARQVVLAHVLHREVTAAMRQDSSTGKFVTALVGAKVITVPPKPTGNDEMHSDMVFYQPIDYTSHILEDHMKAQLSAAHPRLYYLFLAIREKSNLGHMSTLISNLT